LGVNCFGIIVSEEDKCDNHELECQIDAGHDDYKGVESRIP